MKTTPQCPYLHTNTGREFYFDEPTFDIEEIAHALANQCRFSGHTREFYSVAEHSVLVSRLSQYLGLGCPYEGLLHDAHEAYLIDMPSPWKPRIEGYRKHERRLNNAMRAAFGLSETPGYERADKMALFIEAHHLLPSGDTGLYPVGVNEALRDQARLIYDSWKPECWNPRQAKTAFLTRYAFIRP